MTTAVFANTDRLSWVEVDSRAIAENTCRLRRLVGERTAVFGVVKADGYGHGAVEAANAMLRGGATTLAAATVGEARRLRRGGVDAPILVLGYAPPEHIEDALRYDLALAVGSPETLFTALAVGHAAGRAIPLHLKIDTGMHRLGFLPHELGALLATPEARAAHWQGVFTHLACADEPLGPATPAQLATFEDVLAMLHNAGIQPRYVHAANSAGAIAFPSARYDAVRAGIALYGVAPGPDTPLPSGFAPALAFRTRVVRVADLPAGAAVSYGGRYRTPTAQRIATIAAGYADGVRRSPSWQSVIVNSCRAPIVGRVCMDYAMVDVSAVAGVAVGDEVTLLGSQGDATISAVEVAGWLGTSAYEVLTALVPGEARIIR